MKTLRRPLRPFWILVFVVLIVGVLFLARAQRASPATSERRPETVSGVVQRYGEASRTFFAPLCRSQGIVWPPRRVYLLAFKAEKTLEVWAANGRGPYKYLATFPVLAASGKAGPKLREGDYQVPEGFYRINALNPLSRFHLSMRVNYPNEEDIDHATVPRGQLGGDIYVHGNSVSLGCIALGDPAIEKLFCLVAQTDRASRRILIAPSDLRKTGLPDLSAYSDAALQAHLSDLYQRLQAKLREF